MASISRDPAFAASDTGRLVSMPGLAGAVDVLALSMQPRMEHNIWDCMKYQTSWQEQKKCLPGTCQKVVVQRYAIDLGQH
eukprot:2035414-Amphidinium_carterae.1